jgi:predicted secreted Zn-dependent protease
MADGSLAVVDTGAATAALVTSTTGGSSSGQTAVTDDKRATSDPTPKRRSTKPKQRSEVTLGRRVDNDPKPRQERPRRTVRRVPKVRMPAITSSYFGGGVTIARFRISGDTRSQILRSIRTRGPHGGAQGVTQPFLKYRFTFKYDRRGRCRVARTGSTAVAMSFRITLPRWAATVGTDRTTASWWADELRETAAHERRHVRMWRNAVAQANRVVASSSCRNVGRRLDSVWNSAIVANCRFDSSEYGISMRACLRR